MSIAHPHAATLRRLMWIMLAVAGLVLAGWAVLSLMRGPVSAPQLTGLSGAYGEVADSGTATSSASPAARGAQVSTSSGDPARLAPHPLQLTLPRLGLEVPVEQVGVDEEGLMQVPDSGGQAGWYRFGAVPGDPQGSVVIAGHVDTREGLGAFANLGSLEVGDEVLVELSDGSTVRYQVQHGLQLAKDELPVSDVFRREGEPVLRLVTCAGPWRPGAQGYSDNLIVTAGLVDPSG